MHKKNIEILNISNMQQHAKRLKIQTHITYPNEIVYIKRKINKGIDNSKLIKQNGGGKREESIKRVRLTDS